MLARTIALLLMLTTSAALAGERSDRPRDQGSNGGRHGQIINEIILDPGFAAERPSDASSKRDDILGALGECVAHGTTRISPCLRGRETSVAIRRLEACVGSEFIPPQASDVRACLSTGNW